MQDKYTEAQYKTMIKEGMWTHITDDSEPVIEVTGIDWIRKQVYLPNEVFMSFDDLLNEYCSTSDWASRIKGSLDHGGAQSSILGGLEKESDLQSKEQPKTVTKKSDILITDDLVQIEDYKPETNDLKTFFKPIEVDKSTSEYRMISDAINLSSEKEVSISSEFDIIIPFDINKVAKLANMFDIGSDKIADIILSDENGIKTLSAILVAVIETVKDTNK